MSEALNFDKITTKQMSINNPANSQQMLSGSYVITVDDYDTYKNPRLIDRNTFTKFSFKNGDFSETAQLDFSEYGVDFKTPEYPLEFLSGLLRLNTYHEECCDRVSLDVTKHGWDVVSTKKENNEKNMQKRQEIIDWLNSMPNPLSDTLQEVTYDYEALGCAGIEIIRENGLNSPPQHFKRFDVTSAKLSTDGKRLKQTVGTHERWFLLYDYNYNHPNNKISLNRETGEILPFGSVSPDIEAHEVLWIRKYKTNSDSYGSAKISKAVDVIESEIGRANFNKKFFENYGMPAFAVIVTGDFTDYESKRYNPDGTLNEDFDETKTLKYIIGEQLKEIQMNPHSALVITIPTNMNMGDVSVQIIPLSNDVKEASFRLLREDNKKEICAAHGMSSDLIGTTQVGNLGGNSLELDLSSYGKNKIKPIQVTLANKVTRPIYEKFESTDFRFVLNEHELEDKDKKLERVLKLGNAGLVTRREQMAMLSSTFNINPDKDDEYLDKYLINGRTEEEMFERYGYYNNYNNYWGNSYVNKNLLENIEDELLNEVNRLYGEENGRTSDTSTKNQSKTRIPEYARRIIRANFRNRKKHKE